MLKEIIDKFKSEKDNGSRTFDLKAELVKLWKTSGNKETSPNVVTGYHEEIESLRESILSNLRLNTFFISVNTDIKHYEPIFEALSCDVNENEKDLKHKLTCMFHMANSNLGRKFVHYLKECTTIKTHDLDDPVLDEFKAINNSMGISDIDIFFRSIMENKNISAKIEKLASSISGKSLSTFCKDVKLILFSCRIVGLHGFSGDGAIYVNIDEIVTLYRLCDQFYRNRPKFVNILKLKIFIS